MQRQQGRSYRSRPVPAFYDIEPGSLVAHPMGKLTVGFPKTERVCYHRVVGDVLTGVRATRPGVSKMIVFGCPHCSNRLEVDDSYAGHDGWCRKCKNMITVPRRGSRALDELTPAERYDRLAKAFQHAATKADKYHVLFLRTAEENERLTAQVQELAGMSDRLARAERALDDLRDGHDALSGPEGARQAPNDESAVEALKQDVVRLAAELARERGERAAAFEAAERVAKLNEEVRGALDTLTAHKQDIEEQTTLTNGAVERVRDDLELQHRRLIQASARLEALNTTVDALRAEREDARKHGGSKSEIISDLAADAAASRVFKTELADLRAKLDAVTGQVREFQKQVEQADGNSARLTAVVAEFETSRSSVESLAASVRCASESLKEAHSQLAAIRNELGEAVSSMGKVRREIDEERTARGNAEREYDRLRMRVEDLAAGLEEIKYGAAPIGTPLHGAAPIGTPLSSAEASPTPEAVISGELSEEEVATDATESKPDAIDGEVVAAEVIDEDSESAQQMMLNTFLRFMHSSPRDKR